MNYTVKTDSKIFSFFITLLILVILSMSTTSHAASKQRSYATPEKAVQDFVSAVKSSNEKALLSIFGSSARKLLKSGDPVDDKERAAKFIRLYEEKNSLVPKGEDKILQIGNDDYPFPIPLAKKGKAWFFDTEKGREEILNRRIGANELQTIQVMLAIVDAQREYAQDDHDGDGLLAYADRFASDFGKKNGLYWETGQGENPSPLGELVVKARAEGYKKGKNVKPSPYHGYFFRILTRQGEYANGGAFDYFEKGRMIGGFAAIAYPAVYGNSGIMTFVVNHEGVIYQKDLGKGTQKTARAIKAFNPGPGWEKVHDRH